MNVDAEAKAIVEAAMKTPKRGKPAWWRSADNLPEDAIHCEAHGPFCGGDCPDQPPCVPGGIMIDCQDCTPKMRIEWSGAHGPFCGGGDEGCPDQSLCIPGGAVIDCQDCTPEMRIEWNRANVCPCWEKNRGERSKKYKVWKRKHDWDNVLTTERHRSYSRGRRLANPLQSARPENKNYTLGRKCGKCGVSITDRNKSGCCKKHVRT